MKAEFEIECKDPEKIIKAIEPDMDETDKFDVKLKAEKNKVRLVIESKDITGILAAMNSYLRIIKTLEEIK